MRHTKILVLGGSGFVGSRLIAQLVADGRRVIVPSRRYDRVKHLSVLPTVEVAIGDISQPAFLTSLVARADAVINLVGVLHSRRGGGPTGYGPQFAAAHVELPKRVVAACVAGGVTRLLHMSALGAAANAPSMYLRSKAAGEAVVLGAPTLQATVFQPSVLFGEGDAFLNLFAGLQRWFPILPLGGAQARFQPIYVEDVARAFVHALDRQETFGKTYELAGPRVYTLRELVQLAGRYAGHARPVLGLPDGLARLQALALEFAPGGPLMSRDNLDSMRVDNVARGPIAPELDVTPASLDAIAPLYLGAAGEHSRFGDYRAHRSR
ncbi:MAG: complex I NDUFA9 subunit family protein [Pseudomonadota bacterium]|nr:complex I NDUFA9 subunit family protein [Pseudomonadota bacterium]